MKSVICVFFFMVDAALAGKISGLITAVQNGEVKPAKGSVTVGVLPSTPGQLDPMKVFAEAISAQRIKMLDSEGRVSFSSVPEGVPLYVSIFLEQGYGNYAIVNLAAGQELDISRLIADSKIGGVSFNLKVVWSPGIVFKSGEFRPATCIGKNNFWEYIPAPGDEDGSYVFKNVQPGIYRVGVHSVLESGVDRYEEMELEVTPSMGGNVLLSASP